MLVLTKYIAKLVDLFVSMDWSAYVAEYRSHSRPKYQRVRPQTVAAVLEKYLIPLLYLL